MLKLGLYDDLITAKLRDELHRLDCSEIVPLFGKIEPSQLPDYLTRFLAARLSEAIRIYGPEDSARQIELANAVLESVSRRSDELAYPSQQDRLFNKKFLLPDSIDIEGGQSLGFNVCSS